MTLILKCLEKHIIFHSTASTHLNKFYKTSKKRIKNIVSLENYKYKSCPIFIKFLY